MDRDYDDEFEDDGEAQYDYLYKQIGPEWARDHAKELFEEHYPQAVEEFTFERLRSYYLAEPNLAKPAFDSLSYARSLMPSSKAALVFAVAATELAVKAVLLKPIIFGLVHTEELASFIADMAMQQKGMDRFQALLAEVLSQFGDVELRIFKREDSRKTLWQEITEVQKARNAVVHEGQAPTEGMAELAISISETLLCQILPRILRGLKLRLDDSMTVCQGLPKTI